MQSFLNNKAKSIYIHIPFCVKKCNYCAFISYENADEYEKLYVQSLCEEITQMTDTNNFIDTLYIGGGTPNILSLKSLEKIFSVLNDKFKFNKNPEITMEFNPKLSNLDYFSEVKNIGVNRISLGAQSFDDKILKTLGRIHTSEDTLTTIEYIKNAGIENYSLDLIYGVFGQDINILKNDLNNLKKLKPNHVSTYGLKIEKGTPFESFSKFNLPDEDICAQMYMCICNELKDFGYIHYEISNFAQNGYESKHNMAYWQCKEYYGFGVAAHGYLNKIRYKNTDNLKEYFCNPHKKEILSVNSDDDILEEKIFLGLRTSDGVNFNEIKSMFNINLYEKHKNFFDELVQNGHGKIRNNSFFLTEKGFLVSNYIMAKLIS